LPFFVSKSSRCLPKRAFLSLSFCVQATFIQNILHCDVTNWNTWGPTTGIQLNPDEEDSIKDMAQALLQLISIMANLRYPAKK
jgi:hypothetical protein